MVLQVDFTSDEAPERLAQSIRETGFAVITEHPIPWELVASTYEEWASFFASEVKHAYPFQEAVEGQWGYFPFRSENAKDSGLKDLKEFYHVYKWAPLPAGVSENTRALHSELERLAGTLLGWIEDINQKPARSWRISLAMLPFALLLIAYLAGSAPARRKTRRTSCCPASRRWPMRWTEWPSAKTRAVAATCSGTTLPPA